MESTESRLEKLKRMQREALHRHNLAESNFKRAKERLEGGVDDVNVLSGIIREMQKNEPTKVK